MRNTPVGSDINKTVHWVDIIHGRYTAWVILFASFLITFAAWKLSSDYALERAQDRFSFQASEAEQSIKKRMLDYEQMLRGGVGLFNASVHVNRAEWHQYVTTLEIEKHYPGVQGVGFSLWISPAEKDKHIQEVRAEGFPQYVVKPEGERNQYSAIIYLEPFADRNLRAFGFDMFSEATRREAMTKALETGEPALSGRVTLLQETNKDVQYGFLMYLPVYKKTSHTKQERYSNIYGFVYSPFRIRDLMHGILGTGSSELMFEIYDATDINQERILHSSNADPVPIENSFYQFEQVKQLEIAGHVWTVRFRPTEAFERINSTTQPTVIAVGGVVIDILLFLIILSLARLRMNAIRLANQTAQKLGESEQHFKAIADTANDGIITANSSGNITYFNKAAENIFNYESREIIGKPISIIASHDLRFKHDVGFRKFIDSKNAILRQAPHELVGVRKNGETFPIELSFSSWSANGERFVNAIVRDITERKKIERMKNEFISTVSHELRTPLTAISGSLSLVNSGTVGDVPAEAVNLLTIAKRNVDRLASLINDILDIDKIEAGQLPMKLVTHKVTSLIARSIEENQSIAKQADVVLRVSDMTSSEVNVDADRFHQVMTNLISNAVKFSSSNSSVTVGARDVNDRVIIYVEDKGRGIPEDFQPHVFKKFAQADSSDRRSKGGTGLGLSITKALVEKFGGKIYYQSKQNVGTTFFIELPKAN